MNRLVPTFFFALASAAHAHVSLEPAQGRAGTPWSGVLHVGHGCEHSPTTSLDVVLPAGVTATRVTAGTHWKVVQAGNEIIWTAQRGHALDAKQGGDFALSLRLPPAPGPVWIKVLQRCQGASEDWSQVPASGTSTEGLKRPAVLLQVLDASQAAAAANEPVVEGAWVRASVPGQQATGAFMRITSKEPVQLVGVSTPVAGQAEVHEMKMEGDVMRMRPAGAIEIAPGRPLELKSGGYHLMLQELRQPLQAGATVPLTLVFRNAQGTESRVSLRVPVALQGPSGASDSGHAMHGR